MTSVKCTEIFRVFGCFLAAFFFILGSNSSLGNVLFVVPQYIYFQSEGFWYIISCFYCDFCVGKLYVFFLSYLDALSS